MWQVAPPLRVRLGWWNGGALWLGDGALSYRGPSPSGRYIGAPVHVAALFIHTTHMYLRTNRVYDICALSLPSLA